MGSDIYYTSEGGRCQITLTSVTFANGVASALEAQFVAETYTFKRDLPPLVINDGVFRWVRA